MFKPYLLTAEKNYIINGLTTTVTNLSKSIADKDPNVNTNTPKVLKDCVEDNEEPKTYIASFYPTIITQNYDNFRYKYGDIWNLDILTLELREDCKYHTTYFTRSVFVKLNFLNKIL